jgi:hypothetical protein
MQDGDKLEWFVNASKELKRPSSPPKRRQPKVTRHQSSRMKIVGSQQSDPIKAAYQPETRWNQTPVADDGFEGTLEVGPGDRNNSAVNWRTGNMTVEPSINGNKIKKAPAAKGTYVKRAGAPWGNKVRTDYTALAAKFEME